MAGEIPVLDEQAMADIMVIDRALCQIEASLSDRHADARNMARNIRMIRRGLHNLAKDLRYLTQFSCGTVQRPEAGVR